MVEVSDLDEDDLADCVDGDGEGTFKLVKILLNKLVDKPVPLQDRMTVAGEWRKVTVTVTEEDATVGVLRSEWGELLDEPPDTPKGELSIVESIHFNANRLVSWCMVFIQALQVTFHFTSDIIETIPQGLMLLCTLLNTFGWFGSAGG